MFFLKTILKAITRGLKTIFSNADWRGWLFLLVPIGLAISGIYILDIIGIIVCLLIIYFIYIPEIKSAYEDLMSDEDNFPDGNHTVYSRNYRRSYSKICKVNGKLHGKYSKYVNDKIHFECSYKNGKKDGYSKNYFDNGQVSLQSYWEKGKQEGEAITFLKDGTVVRKSELNNNELIKSTEFYLNGKIRMINIGTKYEFYIWNESLDKSIKKCEFDLSLELVDSTYPGPPRVKQKKFNGIWTNYNLNGNIDYELKFKETSGYKLEKTNYDVNGNKESSIFVSCKLIISSILAFHSRYIRNRLTPNEHGLCFYSYNNGVKGPPGANRNIDIEIDVITSLEDIIEIEET